jgi:hypothetical protein
MGAQGFKVPFRWFPARAVAEMGFVPPPPPPPWGFNKANGSLDEIEERVLRQLIPIADLPATMLCDACNAVALQLTRKLGGAQERAGGNQGC